MSKWLSIGYNCFDRFSFVFNNEYFLMIQTNVLFLSKIDLVEHREEKIKQFGWIENISNFSRLTIRKEYRNIWYLLKSNNQNLIEKKKSLFDVW